MEPMFEHEVRSRLATQLDSRTVELQLNTFGLAESEAGERLSGIEDQYQVSLGYRAALPEIQIKIWASGSDGEATLSKVRQAAEAVRKQLGDRHVFAEGDKSLAAALGDLLCSRGLSLGLAESCTGGLIAELVSSVPGASRYFNGGVISYDNRVKTKLLGVRETLIEEHGAVSESVALAMAEGALSALGCDLALSTTGVAGPDGGSKKKPVGLVHFAVLRKGGLQRVEHKVFAGNRQQVQRRAAFFGLWLARQTLLGDPP
jgi:nicotinamide-nucleotide amidase